MGTSHGGDKGDYLNQIITDTKGFGVKDGDINALKKFITWLALYQEWQQPLTEKIPEVSAEYRQKLNELISNFSWEQFAQTIKDNVKQYEEEQKAKAKAKKEK